VCVCVCVCEITTFDAKLRVNLGGDERGEVVEPGSNSGILNTMFLKLFHVMKR
jgi:hypothetical protein